jgi:6-phosphogluconolactonase
MRSGIRCRRQIPHIAVILPFALFAFVLTPAAGSAPGKYLLYIGTYTDHGSQGIYAAGFDASIGKVTSLGLAAEAAEPSFLTVEPRGKFLYAINETSNYNGQPTGAVSAFAINPDTGKLSFMNQVSSRDEGPAHIILDRTGKFALISNYTLGSVAVCPVLKDGRLGDPSWFVQHQGSSVDVERQKGPHAHAIAISPDNRFAIVADLGLDQLLIYPFDAVQGTLGSKPKIVKTAPGSGPRHLVFGSDGRFLYVITEMKSTVIAYSYDATTGDLHEFETISTLPADFHGRNSAAEIEIHPNGRFLFASNRGDDSIAVFAIDSHLGSLKRLEIDPAGGKTPRNFAVDPSGSWLLVANQDSNAIVVFHIDPKTGHLVPTGETLEMPSPVCLKFAVVAAF